MSGMYRIKLIKQHSPTTDAGSRSISAGPGTGYFRYRRKSSPGSIPYLGRRPAVVVVLVTGVVSEVSRRETGSQFRKRITMPNNAFRYGTVQMTIASVLQTEWEDSIWIKYGNIPEVGPFKKARRSFLQVWSLIFGQVFFDTGNK